MDAPSTRTVERPQLPSTTRISTALEQHWRLATGLFRLELPAGKLTWPRSPGCPTSRRQMPLSGQDVRSTCWRQLSIPNPAYAVNSPASCRSEPREEASHPSDSLRFARTPGAVNLPCWSTDLQALQELASECGAFAAILKSAAGQFAGAYFECRQQPLG